MTTLRINPQVRWICHTVRTLAAAYALWSLWLTVSFWSQGDRVFKRFQWLTQSDSFKVTPMIQGLGLALNLVLWGLLAFACLEVWRLFTAYLQGNILSKESTSRFAKVCALGIATLLLDLLCRPLFSLLVTGTLPFLGKLDFYFNPHDLILIIFLMGLYALAHIFKAASEMADDHAHIL